MTISLVGQAGIAGVSGITTETIDYASADGNTLILTGLIVTSPGSPASITSITDTAGNTWEFSATTAQNPPSQQFTAGSNGVIAFVAWCINAKAVTSVTIATSNANFWRVALAEFSGIDKADTAAAATGTGTIASTTISLANADDLVIGAMDDVSATVDSGPSGWTDFTGSGSVIYVAWGLPGSAGSYTPEWTMATSDSWAVAIAAFSPPSPVAGTPVIAALSAAGVL